MKSFVKSSTVLQGFLVSGENKNQINSPKSNISYSGFEVKYVSDKMPIIKTSPIYLMRQSYLDLKVFGIRSVIRCLLFFRV
ncbi:hypothetical protein LFAB_04340 [Lactiplantibacillus fabifermentans T30PCM01]|uniref:Uncharacterized protein n=1 Tax=Lactiplantibacillus fabifermentans T30PCM01 TaxID=1400520 RepID=W6TCU1_9LACO|nr:hypothetical protein LFAB_04340 [Lactiplantibacillus fabifermentans T30PCM01]